MTQVMRHVDHFVRNDEDDLLQHGLETLVNFIAERLRILSSNTV